MALQWATAGGVWSTNLCLKDLVCYLSQHPVFWATSQLLLFQVEMIVHGFIKFPLDYYPFIQGLWDHLEMVQNAAARLLNGYNRMDHISPILSSLQWVPMKFRAVVKFLLSLKEPCSQVLYLWPATTSGLPKSSLQGLLVITWTWKWTWKVKGIECLRWWLQDCGKLFL